VKPKRRLTQIFSLMLSGVSLVSIILIGALWISFESRRSEEESRRLRLDYVAEREAAINLETDRICDYIEAQRQSSEMKFLRALKDRVDEADGLIRAVAESPGPAAPDRDQTQALLLNGLRRLSFNQGRGRYFISTLSGREIFIPGQEFPESGRLENRVGPQAGPAAFAEIADSLAQTGEGFFRYNLMPVPGREDETQMAYLKLYAPYGWIIGTSESPGDWARDLQAELLDWAAGMTLPVDNYLMIFDYHGHILAHPEAARVGRNVFGEPGGDPAFRKAAAEIIRGAKDHSQGFVRYRAVGPGPGPPTERVACFQAIPAWGWVVSTWVYFRDLETIMAERQAQLTRDVRSQIVRIVAISVSMLLVIMLLSKLLSALASRSFAAFFAFFENAADSSVEIDPGRQPFEEFARLAVAANNMINQRKLATGLLRESELKFKTVFDVSPQVITMSDLDGRLLDASEEYQKFSRRPLKEAKGRPLADSFVLPPESLARLWSDLKNDGAVFGREIEAVNPDGSPLTFLAFGKMIHLRVGSFILAIFTDISALKKSEKEKLVLQEKLARATKMEAMGLMAAEVAHDLNNILSGIIGYPQLLLMDPNLSERQREALKEILTTGQRAAAVVSDLLTIARGVAAAKVSLPLNSVVTDYRNSPECRQLKEFFPDVELDLQLDPRAGNIIASAVHLTKVVMNLVSNAFEAMPPDRKDGRVTVRTRLAERSEPLKLFEGGLEPGRYALLSVSDNGPGIPAGDVANIFEPFYSKKIKGRSGTGLGLAIVWNTITDHQAGLDLRTGPGGTTFDLYFKPTEEKSQAPASGKNLDDYRGAGQRILVVDDVDIQRKLAGKMLTTLGYSPVAVPSGEAAVEFLKKEDVDLVILDMIMHPGMNGRETYGAIMEFKPGQKAIIASGMAETDEVAKAQAMGAGQFVNKPYTIEDLAAAVQKALSR
jgi:PAS domain S-box-containing protein